MWKSTLKIILMSHTQADSFICKTVQKSKSFLGKTRKSFFVPEQRYFTHRVHFFFFFKYLILVWHLNLSLDNWVKRAGLSCWVYYTWIVSLEIWISSPQTCCHRDYPQGRSWANWLLRWSCCCQGASYIQPSWPGFQVMTQKCISARRHCHVIPN